MRPQDRFTNQRYWDTNWRNHVGEGISILEIPEDRGIFESPAVAEFWNKLLAPHLPTGHAKVVELGSAPGRHLLNWHRRFGYDIFGVDFSQEGIQQQNLLFGALGIESAHSIYADFLDPSFAEQYREIFDVAHSGGVIEHFSTPEDAVSAHVKLLKPGGLLVISIPNIKGMYRMLLPKAIVATHNLDLMRLPVFAALFDRPDLETLFCGYHGRINLGVAMHDNSLFCRILNRGRVLCNVLLRIVPLPENQFTSPSLLYIGRKRSLATV